VLYSVAVLHVTLAETGIFLILPTNYQCPRSTITRVNTWVAMDIFSKSKLQHYYVAVLGILLAGSTYSLTISRPILGSVYHPLLSFPPDF
jgi:hypothetical protein